LSALSLIDAGSSIESTSCRSAPSGRRDQFEGLLQKKYGVAKAEAKRQVDEFEKRCHC
jgi:hypothetical protein